MEYATVTLNNKEEMSMGLVTRRSLQLDKMFDQFAVDPKEPKKQRTDSANKSNKDNKDDQADKKD